MAAAIKRGGVCDQMPKIRSDPKIQSREQAAYATAMRPANDSHLLFKCGMYQREKGNATAALLPIQADCGKKCDPGYAVEPAVGTPVCQMVF
jgi:hypothetical protein